MGQIYQLKQREPLRVGYVISLYTQEEIDLCVLALNHHAFGRFKATERDLSAYDPEMIIAALANIASNSIFSSKTQSLAKKIISTVQAKPLQHNK